MGLTNTIDDFTENILRIPNKDLLDDLSQIIDGYEPVSNRKGMTSYKDGRSGTFSGSEYDPSKDSENETEMDKSMVCNQPKKINKKGDIAKEIAKKLKKDNKKKGINDN